MPLRGGRRENAGDRLGERHELERGEEDETDEANRDGVGAVREPPRHDGVGRPQPDEHEHAEGEEQLPGGVGGTEWPGGTDDEREQ